MRPIKTSPPELSQGGSFRHNRRELAEAMVQIEGDGLVIESPFNPRLFRQTTAVIEDVSDVDQLREALVDVLYDLLTAMADDVQDRFAVRRSNMRSRNGQYPPKDPDEIVGTNLISVFQAQKAAGPQQTSLGTDPE